MPPAVHTFRGSAASTSAGSVRVPSGFAWSPSFSILEQGPGRFTTSLRTGSLKLSTATTRYVDVATGNDANTGLSSASPKKSIWSAINVGANDTIYVKGSADPSSPTVYHYDWGWRLVPVQNTNVIAVSDFTTLAPGYVVSSSGHKAGDSLLGTWSLTADGAGPHVYEATLATSPGGGVIDASAAPQSSGAMAALTSRASIALVEANPGSWYHDGTKLYVRTADSRAPDAALRPLKAAINGHLNTAISIYVERIIFEGGNSRCFYLQDCSTATFVDCTFRNGQQQGCELNVGAGVTGSTHTVYLVRCRALGNAGDGLGATVAGANEVVRWLEWDCEAAGNSGSGTDQGSSLHFTAGNSSVSGLRVGGWYHGNKTDGVADVGGCGIWMLGSRVTGEAIGVYCGDAGTTWLHGCVLAGNTNDITTDNASGVVNTTGSHYKVTAGNGTVITYAP